MPVEYGTAGEFNSIKIAKGVFASLGTITEIRDMSNYPGKEPVHFKKNGEPYQLCIEVEYEREDGGKWSSKFFGNFDLDKVRGTLKRWDPFRNSVQDFFEVMYGTREEAQQRTNDDWTIGAMLTGPLIGKKFYRISYIHKLKENGKGEYWDWRIVFPETATIEEMQDKWAKASIKMTSYDPSIIDEIEKNKDDTKFEYGANTTSPDVLTEEEEFEL
jgi:hypothetical protein